MTKEKQIRTYDEDGFRRRAACLCIRDPEESEIMLVTSSRTPEYWIVPGGGVEPNENPNDAAVREAEEEAGVKGILKRSLGDIENVDRKHRTSVYVLEVREELDVWEDCRKRCWFSVKEALNLLAVYKPVQCTYVKLMIQTSPSLSLRHMLSYPISASITTNHDSLSSASTTSESTSTKNHNSFHINSDNSDIHKNHDLFTKNSTNNLTTESKSIRNVVTSMLSNQNITNQSCDISSMSTNSEKCNFESPSNTKNNNSVVPNPIMKSS